VLHFSQLATMNMKGISISSIAYLPEKPKPLVGVEVMRSVFLLGFLDLSAHGLVALKRLPDLHTAVGDDGDTGGDVQSENQLFLRGH
jgi:hypothetical protein